MQLIQVEKGNSVLLMGPRGNWWTELLMHIGAKEIVVLETDALRREVLAERWNDLRLDVVAKAFDCNINIIGIGELDDYTPEHGFDRVLSTGMFPSLPLSVMMRLQDDGYAVLPIENDDRSMLQLIQHHGEGELMAQWVSCWDVDPWSEEVLVALETGAELESCETIDNSREKIEAAWCLSLIHI